jgi:hypothetical protein
MRFLGILLSFSTLVSITLPDVSLARDRYAGASDAQVLTLIFGGFLQAARDGAAAGSREPAQDDLESFRVKLQNCDLNSAETKGLVVAVLAPPSVPNAEEANSDSNRENLAKAQLIEHLQKKGWIDPVDAKDVLSSIRTLPVDTRENALIFSMVIGKIRYSYKVDLEKNEVIAVASTPKASAFGDSNEVYRKSRTLFSCSDRERDQIITAARKHMEKIQNENDSNSKEEPKPNSSSRGDL